LTLVQFGTIVMLRVFVLRRFMARLFLAKKECLTIELIANTVAQYS